jgi:hypothetical protein
VGHRLRECSLQKGPPDQRGIERVAAQPAEQELADRDGEDAADRYHP